MEQTQKKYSKLNILLWVLQILFALLYVGAGFSKTVKPIPELALQVPWVVTFPAALVRFIGISELLGAIGLILPAALKIRPQLTTLAASALSFVMLLANVFHIYQGEFQVLPMTGIIFILLTFTAYGRWKLAPFTSKGKQ
ncbi:MAG: DoxX family protein [Bacteroidota bacterium]|nr:DoxX family protein [Bacteroidota bacterium]